MTGWTLVIMPDGRAILTTEGDVPANAAKAITEAFTEWRDANPARVMIVPGCRVRLIESVELELPESGT